MRNYRRPPPTQTWKKPKNKKPKIKQIKTYKNLATTYQHTCQRLLYESLLNENAQKFVCKKY